MGEPGESYQVRFVDGFGKVAGTFDGTLTSGQIIDLGRVGVKSGSYSVEISSSKTTLQPFRANVKPAQPKIPQPLEEEVVVIDLDSIDQNIIQGNENNLDNLESNTVTLGKVGSIPGQSMESSQFIDKIENETNTDNLTETEFQPLGEANQSGVFNQEAPFNQNDTGLQTSVESLTSSEQQGASQPQQLTTQQGDSGTTEVTRQNNPQTQIGEQVVSPFVPGQSINDIAGVNTAVSAGETKADLPEGRLDAPEGQITVNQIGSVVPQDNKPNQTVSEKLEESPRIIQGFQSLAQNVSRGIQNLAQNLGLSSDTANQDKPQGGQAEPKDELKGPIYQKLLTAVSTGVFYNDDGTTFFAQPGTQAYEAAVENIKARVNNSESPIYDDNGSVVAPVAIVNQISQIANRVLAQGAAQAADQTATQSTALSALQNTTRSTAHDIAESVAQDAAQKAVQNALQNSNVDSVQDVVQNVLQSTAQNATENAVQEVVQSASSIADKITEQFSEQNVIQQVSQEVSRAATQNALQAAEQIAENSIQEALVSTESIQGVIKDSVTSAAQITGQAIQEKTQELFETVQDAAKVVIRETASAQSAEETAIDSENSTETDNLQQLTYQELAQASGLGQAAEIVQSLEETLNQTESAINSIEQNQNNRISIQRAGQIPGDNLGYNPQSESAGYYNEDGVFVEQSTSQLINQQGPTSVEQVQLPDAQRAPGVENYQDAITSAGQSAEGSIGSESRPASVSPNVSPNVSGDADATNQAINQINQSANEANQVINQINQATIEAGQAATATAQNIQALNQSADRLSSPEMISLPEAQIPIGQGNPQQNNPANNPANNTATNMNSAASATDSATPQSKIYSVTEQVNVTQTERFDSNGNVLPVSGNDNLNQTTYSTLPENQASNPEQEQSAPRRTTDRINLSSSRAGANQLPPGLQNTSVQVQDQTGQVGQNNIGNMPGPLGSNPSIFDATVQPGYQSATEPELNTLQQVSLPKTEQFSDSDTESSVPRLFAINRRTTRPDTIGENDVQQLGRINLNNTLQPRDIEKISEQIINEGLLPQYQEATGVPQLDYQGLDQQPSKTLNPAITGVSTSASSEVEDEDENDAKLKSVKYVTVGGDTLMKTEVPKDQPTDGTTTQQIKEALSAESIIYQELLKERERFRANLEAERGNNRANLRRAEQQIQQELVKVITEQPLEAENESASPINQIIQSIIKEDREIAFERETESIQNTIQNVQERQQEANKVAQKETLEAIKTSQEKAPEKVFIDATKIIQMIQEKQKENESAKEIDEFLLRQRIERELKYEFNQMQIDHEKKLRMVYRKMIEQMYLDMLNS